MLGSIEVVVTDAAVRELICNWNDHEKEDQIDEALELENWKKRSGMGG